MDIKMVKTQVCAKNVIGKQSVEHPIDVDFTIPDYCGEIERILKCVFIPRINSKSVSGQNGMVDGHVTVRIIYCNSENKIFSFDHIVPFTKSIELQGIDSQSKIKAEAYCSYCNCRAVTQRKVDVHGAIEIKLIAKGEIKNDVVCDVDNEDIQILRGSAPILNSKGYCEKPLIVEEEIEIGQGQSEIVSIIRTSAAPCVSDMKIINGKVLIRGEMQICILYCGNEGRPAILRSALPFSQVLDIEEANENCKCSAEVEMAYFEVKPKATPSGQIRIFAVNSKLIVTGECYCQDDVPVILDAYSVCDNCQVKYTDIEFEKICDNFNENVICKEQNEIPGNGCESVVDLWCEVGNVNSRFNSDTLLINGVVKTFMILYDVNGNAIFSEKPIDFEYSHSFDRTFDGAYVNPQVEAINCSYAIMGENLVEIKVELKITGGIYEVQKMPLVVDIVPYEGQRKNNEDNTAMVIYFAESGEKIWDIARKYNSSMEEIVTINELTGDVLAVDKALIIPIMG